MAVFYLSFAINGVDEASLQSSSAPFLQLIFHNPSMGGSAGRMFRFGDDTIRRMSCNEEKEGHRACKYTRIKWIGKQGHSAK
ncbi:MAG: hypothetical protein Q4P30_02745 [Eubacteriales bacterium]|nr:hypothetical protein [Eubacteriales bacterium]